MLKLIRLWLDAPVQEPPSCGGGKPRVYRNDKGAPQGGVTSPLMANLYLHWFDGLFYRSDGPAHWAQAQLVRDADDFVVLARYQSQRLVAFIETTLEQRFGLEINRDKTRIVDLKEPKASLEFRGYSFRFDRSLKGRAGRYLNMQPSQKSLTRGKAKLREMTGPHHGFEPIPDLIGRINRMRSGGTQYFSQGYPAKA
jgi:RNA-directed DNA polymerase